MNNPPSSSESPNGLDPLKRFTALLGDDVFFVPCIPGTKKPLETYVERCFKDTKTSEYLKLFQGANIAIFLGEASNGLCTIDFDTDNDKTTFLALNPKLAQTTRSRGCRGETLWLRINGEYPQSCNPTHKHFEWRADRRLSTIYGRHPKGMDYILVCDAPPQNVEFSEIIWPSDWELPWKRADDSNLKKLYGEPFFIDEDGALASINEPYWAGLHAAENTLLYEPDEKSFYEYHPNNGLYEIESADAIRTKIASRLLEASRQSNVFDLQKKRSANTLNNVISHLRGIVERRRAFVDRQGVIHLANGVIVFEGDEAELRPFSAKFRSRNQSPIAFDENAKCERFLNELVLPAVHPEDVGLLQKYAGMALLGYNRAQRFLILDGESGRGKTQFANVMQGLVGRANVTQLRTKFLSERFEIYRYLKKTLLVGVDVDADFLSTKGAADLKGLVGGDWFDAEQKGALAMSKSVHWAFDKGIFTISDQYEVIIHPEAKNASTKAFPLFDKDRKQIVLPSDPAYHPHQEALAWHRKERFGLFTKT